ncbi:secoisolariciresinol dehydrogenase [Prunus avium]|uniref:Secoisolariciresinol dehydrogenase n=1 Tax=Prunus avium TaxID=42229 RepID=A0A6P5SUU7_PRUAV|nr:secoisolariciresinol dehydrogenase [Prunus avium]
MSTAIPSKSSPSPQIFPQLSSNHGEANGGNNSLDQSKSDNRTSKLIKEEEKETGKVSLHVYKVYSSLQSEGLEKESIFSDFEVLHAHTARLEGKVALITGAASGIGKATASKFISNGAKVVIADIQQQLGQVTAYELGPNATFIACDVSKESDISNAVDFTISKHSQLDIMYANAGVACNTPPSIVDLDLAVFDRVMNINVRGVIAGMKHASRVMIPRKTGSILCTASVTGLMGGLAQHTYSVSKFAVIGIVKSVAAELSKHGIRVNCISPFAIPTPFVLEEMSRIFPGVDIQRLIEITQNAGVLEGTNCEPNDIANAALYLASDDAKYVSGHNLVVDGGFTSFKTLEFPAPDQVH